VGIWNYELLPGSQEPMPKFYVDMHGEIDLENARGIAKFMHHIGLTTTAERFIETVQHYLYEPQLTHTMSFLFSMLIHFQTASV
jgi:phosphate/sulfate permease